MNFSTPIIIAELDKPIDYTSKIFALGSCFSENMGEKFSYFKFQNSFNPFGIIFNPVSIETIISRVVHQQKFTEKDIFFHNNLWQCYEVHSALSNPNKEVFLTSLNQLIESTYVQIIQSTHIIITYGTSWVYQFKSTNEVVANCHKVPQKQFSKELLSVEVIQKSIQNTIDLVQALNPKINFIFTISPVRHIKDGFVENQLSKSHLFTALHSILNTEHSKLNTAYFPSYEIMMDELRDYRFYAEDMLHPSQISINYIWERFRESAISETANITMEAVENIQKGLQHRPFNPQSESHKKFEVNLQSKIATLVAQYSFMKF